MTNGVLMFALNGQAFDSNKNKIDIDYVKMASANAKNIKKYMSIVNWLNSFGISVIVAVINAFEKDRSICREELTNYKEVYLKCSIEERIKRDKKKLYLPALNGKKKHVVDVDIPFEKPIKAELTIDTENSTPEEISKKIIGGLNL